MQISYLIIAASCLNGALGSGRYADISLADVKAHIREGAIFDFLEETLGEDIDISLLDNDDRAELLREWRSLADNVDESRKLWIQRDGNGLALLVAYLLEGIQTRSHETTRRG
jgi:hypothetical protein